MKAAIIYNRTSREDQNPENQLRDCENLAKAMKIDSWDVLQEQESAFKDTVDRPVFESIEQAIRDGEVKTLIVWDFDRLFRSRQKTISFIRDYSKLGLRVHSFRQQWLESLNRLPSPWNEIVFDLMVSIVAWMGEEESRKRSERTKAAVRIIDGVKQSYRGNKWGRKQLPDAVRDQVIQLRKAGKSLREISKEVHYWDSSGNKKRVSLTAVYKIAHNIPSEKPS